MGKRIAIIQGHPDPQPQRFGRALAAAYAEAAGQTGHEVRLIEVAQLDFPLLRSKQDFECSEAPEPVRAAQDALAWAEHLVIFYPLWLGSMPALLKGFFEQVLRPSFAFGRGDVGPGKKRLAGRSARVVITMGMPALAYRWYFGAHGLKSLKRSILGFCGIGPIRTTLVGLVEAGAARRGRALARMRALGRAGR